MTESVVQLREVWAAYNAESVTLHGINIDVERGTSYAIVGPSGSGKSTILKLLNGLMVSNRGTVEVEGRRPDMRDAQFRRILARIGYIPQNLGLVLNSSVLDNIMMGALYRMGRWPALLKRYPKSELDYAHKVLEQVGLPDKGERQAYMLSGGEKRRVAIARALMQKPSMLLADEMVSELDSGTAVDIMELVAEAQKESGLTAIMIHHDIKLALKFADRVALVQRGHKVMELGVDNETILDFQCGTSNGELMEMYGDTQK